MGGPRSSTIRQIERGAVCCKCRNPLPPRMDGGVGARLCLRCMEAQLKTVVMLFDFAHDLYRVTFTEADGRTPLAWTCSYKTQEPLYRIVNASYQPMHAEREMERKLFSVRRGMVRLRLLPGQYERLTRPRRRSAA
ncbi:hypothetical protein [Terriglobus sp.]|uniref:hypothetical protein n=1 Tax=Terriglobus sp. TaxID=1889013 RepID=UPI003AFF6878